MNIGLIAEGPIWKVFRNTEILIVIVMRMCGQRIGHRIKRSLCAIDYNLHEIYNEGEKRGWDKGIVQGIEFGEMKKAKETAVTLAEKRMSAADIADIVKVSVKLVQEWLSGNMSLAK